jgi:hypothetical protein
MPGGSDKVEQCMDTVVAEAGVTLDTGLLCENIIVLSLEISYNFTKAFILSANFEAVCPTKSSLPCLVINLVSETRCIDDGQ